MSLQHGAGQGSMEQKAEDRARPRERERWTGRSLMVRPVKHVLVPRSRRVSRAADVHWIGSHGMGGAASQFPM